MTESRLIARVRRLLLKYGVSATFTRKQGHRIDQETGISKQTGSSESSCKITPPEPFENERVDGKAILYTDARFYLLAADLSDGFVLDTDCRVRFAGVTKQVSYVGKIHLGDALVLYEVGVR